MKYILPVLMLLALPAEAQSFRACGDHDASVDRLKEKFNEDVIFRGLMQNGGVMFELLSAPEGTFTVLFTNTSGLACFMFAGRGGELVEVEENVPGEGT